MKAFEKIIGRVSDIMTVERIMKFLKGDAEAMVGWDSDHSKKVIVEISIKEVEDRVVT